MKGPQNILLGMRIPDVLVAELQDGEIVPLRANEVLGRGRSLVIGVPGAFTPLCSEQHVPGLVDNADRLRRSGFEHLVCIVAGDPFETDGWQCVVDPKRRVRFISDGNLNFAKALGLSTHEQALFLGDRS